MTMSPTANQSAVADHIGSDDCCKPVFSFGLYRHSPKGNEVMLAWVRGLRVEGPSYLESKIYLHFWPDWGY